MTACPAREVLADLLSGGLTGPSADTVATHLDSCTVCQRTLDSLSADRTAPWARPAGDTELVPPAGFLDRLKGLADSPRPPDGRPTVPGYDLHEELGRGGAGVVYRATQLALDRTVAIKVLHGGGQATPEVIARFRTEALAAGRVSHPGVVQVYEVGEWRPAAGAAPLPFVCLEYVAGGPLSKRIDRTPQPPREAAELVAKLAAAVQAAHSAGVLHRDLKPSNVLLDEASGAPKVADFGLARRLDLGSAHTQTGMILGTPSYMAPEQARGDRGEVDARTDVYGLGAVLYELLTGRPPFQGPTPLDTLVQVATADPIPPRRLQPTVPRDLETICLKCLEKEPPDRYPSAAAVGDDLGRFLAGRPTAARPLGVVSRAARVARRNPLPAGLVAALAVVIAGSVIGLSGLYVQSETARKSAETARDRTRAMTDFLLKEIVATPRLDQTGRGQNVKVVQMLDATGPKVDERFADQPELAGAFHHAFGETYRQIGVYPKADFHLNRAIALRTTVLGLDHPDTLESGLSLGILHRQTGQLDAAKAVFAGVLVRATARDPESEQTTRARLELAATLLALRDVDAAEQMFTELVEFLRRQGEAGTDHLGEALTGLAGCLGARGILANSKELKLTAIPLLREAVAVETQRYGPEAIKTLTAQRRLGEHLYRAGEAAAAEPILAANLAVRRRTSPTHPTTYSVIGDLAEIWLQLGRPADAEAAFREALAGHLELMPPGDNLIHLGQLRLGSALMRQGKFAEAEPLLLEALAGLDALKFPRPEYRKRCADVLVELYRNWGKPVEAAKWKANAK